jgi:hypothetical protein
MGDAVVIAHRCIRNSEWHAYCVGKHFVGHHPIANLTAKEDLK